MKWKSKDNVIGAVPAAGAMEIGAALR